MNTMSMQLRFLSSKNTLARIRISNTDFLIDGIAREFRDANNPHNRIPFGRLKYDEAQGGYEFLFDKLTRNKYEGYMPECGVPPMTERVFIPRLKEMEQSPSPEVNRIASFKKGMQESPNRQKPKARKSHWI